MTGFSMILMLLIFIGLTRVAFRRMDMISALVLALVCSSLFGGIFQVAADGNGLMALQMLGLGVLIAPIAALDASPARKTALSVLLCSEHSAGRTSQADLGRPSFSVQHGYAA